MIKLNKIFVVINPATNNQYALKRAAEIARAAKAEIIAHLCIFSNVETSDPDELREVELSRYKPWLETHIQPYRDQGIKVRMELAWNRDWQKEVGITAKKEKPDLIVKASRRSPKQRRLKMLSSDWALFENATCPVLLVNSEVKRTGKFLVAIDINRSDKKYQQIMDLVIDHAKAAARATKSELHVVNSYADQDDYVHVTDVSNRVDVPNKNIHVVGGQPEQVILQVAKKVEAELVIMGLSTKSKLANRIFGYTSEWLLNNLNQDVFVIIPRKTD